MSPNIPKVMFMNGTLSTKEKSGFAIVFGLFIIGTLAATYPATTGRDNGTLSDGNPIVSTPVLKIVTTMLIPYDIAVNVAGEVATVQSIVQPGVDIHTFQGPTATQLQAIENADLLISMGVEDLEPWLDDALASLSLPPPEIELVEATMMKSDPGLGGELNPHVWLDPTNVKRMANKTATELISLAPANETIIRANNVTYQSALDALLLRIQGNVSEFSGLKVVSMHAAFTDLFSLLGVSQLAIVENVEGQEPSQARIDQIIELMGTQSVAILVSQPEISMEETNAIAKAAGVNVAMLYPFPGLEATNGEILDTYIKTMDYNLYALAHPAAPPADDYTIWIIVGVAGGGIAAISIIIVMMNRRKNVGE
nr:metal ABC transporter substrate-binding protein [Candidatus Sigynarchaeota archaeon]